MASFEEDLDRFLRDPDRRPSRNALYVCDTPACMVMLGMRQLPIYVTRAHVANMMHKKSDRNAHWHGLSEDDLLLLPSSMASPAMIIDSLRTSHRGDVVVLLLDQTDLDDLPLIAAIRPNGSSTYDFELRESNHMLSAYGRNGIESFIGNARGQGAILYIDEEKTRDLESQTQLRLLQGLEGLPLNRIIHQSSSIIRTLGLEPGPVPVASLSALGSAPAAGDPGRGGMVLGAREPRLAREYGPQVLGAPRELDLLRSAASAERYSSRGPARLAECREEDFTEAELESLRQTRPDLFDEGRGDDRPAADAPAASALRRAVACGPAAGLRTPHELDLFYEAAFDEFHALSSQPPACFGFQYRIDGDGDHVSEADFERVLPTPHLRSLWLAIANERSEIADLPARGRLAFTAAARDARAARELSEDYLEGDCEVFGTEYEEDDFTEEELAELREERPELFDGPAATGVEGIAPGREPSIPERNGGAR